MTSPRAAAVAATIDPGHDRSIAVLRRWCSGRGWEPFPFQ